MCLKVNEWTTKHYTLSEFRFTVAYALHRAAYPSGLQRRVSRLMARISTLSPSSPKLIQSLDLGGNFDFTCAIFIIFPFVFPLFCQPFRWSSRYLPNFAWTQISSLFKQVIKQDSLNRRFDLFRLSIWWKPSIYNLWNLWNPWNSLQHSPDPLASQLNESSIFNPHPHW